MLSIAELPKYESYKDSGYEWLGKVPDSWGLLANKHIFKIKKNLVGKRSAEYDLLSLTLKGVIKRDMENPEGKFPAEFDTYQEVESGDFVFCLFDVEETPRAVGLSPFDGMITGAYTVLEADPGFDSHFLYYFYLNLDGKKRLKPLYRGLRNTIPKESLMSFKTFVPSLDQQQEIARFLDKKTTQVDEAISIKEQQITLLKERKQIIIQKAVTQGLDPTVPMKDSGVDWIGEIPEYWEVVRFKNLFSQSRLPVRADDGVVTSYRDGQVTLRSNRRMDGYTEAVIEGGYQGIRKGQLVLNSMDAFEGAIGVSESDGKCTPEYVICDAKRKGMSQYYFAYLLREMALAKYILVICNAVRQRAVRIRYNNLASRFMVLPPENEQLKIIKFIESEKIKIDKGVEILRSQTEKLKEYKATLINSAVTGRIKITPDMVED